MEKYSPMSKRTTRFVKTGDVLQGRTKANARSRSPHVRAHYTCVASTFIENGVPCPNRRSACYISFRIHPVDLARESPDSFSALERENSISGAVRDWSLADRHVLRLAQGGNHRLLRRLCVFAILMPLGLVVGSRELYHSAQENQPHFVDIAPK